VKAELSKLKTASQKVTDKEVYVSEPVFDYSIKATGFKVGNKEFEKAVENGTDPTPQTIKTMQDNIKAKKIAFFVLNTQTDSKLVNNLVDLAKKNDIPVLEVTETLPKDKTYTEWMLSQYKAMNKILQGEK
jgi:ABC-type metal ion transport system, periplasmic component/surface adhesin